MSMSVSPSVPVGQHTLAVIGSLDQHRKEASTVTPVVQTNPADLTDAAYQPYGGRFRRVAPATGGFEPTLSTIHSVDESTTEPPSESDAKHVRSASASESDSLSTNDSPPSSTIVPAAAAAKPEEKPSDKGLSDKCKRWIMIALLAASILFALTGIGLGVGLLCGAIVGAVYIATAATAGVLSAAGFVALGILRNRNIL